MHAASITRAAGILLMKTATSTYSELGGEQAASRLAHRRRPLEPDPVPPCLCVCVFLVQSSIRLLPP